MSEITPNQLLRYLQAHAVGRSNAVPSSTLEQALGLGPSKLREMLHELRTAGALIGSSMSSTSGGYYIPASYDEAYAGVQHLKSRIRELSRAYAGQVRAIKRQHPSSPPKQLSPSPPPTQFALFDAPGPRSAPTIFDPPPSAKPRQPAGVP